MEIPGALTGAFSFRLVFRVRSGSVV